MEVIFHSEARTELVEAAAYYDERAGGLGMDFHDEVLAAIELTLRHPRMWPDIGDGIRRCLVRRFPYAVLYETTPFYFYVYAVMNLRRHPDYWKHRKNHE